MSTKIENNFTKYRKLPKVKYSTVLDRLQNLTNTTPTVGDLAKITGLTEKNLYARRSYDREFSEDEIQLINAHFNINLYKDNEDAENATVDYYPDILVSCGNGIFQLNETKEKITIPKALIKGYSEAQKYIVVTAFSDSMQPEIKEKDLLIVRTTDAEEIQDNHIYMFRHDGRFYCKYLSYNLGQLIVRSANPEYPTRHIEKEDLNNFELIGEIVGLMRDFR